MQNPLVTIDLKDKIPSDIMYFCYGINNGGFSKKMEEFQMDPEIQQIMMQYVQKIQADLMQAQQSQMGMGFGP